MGVKKSAVQETSKQKFDLDFVPTISDSEDDVPDLEVASDEEEVGQEETEHNNDSTKTAKKAKKSKKTKKGKKTGSTEEADGDNDGQADLNADFDFNLDDDDLYSTKEELQSWNFEGDDKKNSTFKDIDLDGIIKRKGGLIQLAGVAEDEEAESQEEDDDHQEEKEEEQTESTTQNNEKDDDELAMDGFGMGIQNPGANGEDEQVEDKEGKDEEDEDSSDDEETEELKADGKLKEVPEEEDSAEAIAQFYATDDEAATAKNQTHQTFNSLQLSRPVLKGLSALGYSKPSPIQGASIPIALLGKDIIAGAVTGSGKTAAFMIPIIERLLYKPTHVPATRVIVLTPTRELAIQISDVGKKIARYVEGISLGLAVGGLNLKQQEQQLKTRPDIVIATPGRFIDHIRNSASFSVDSVEILVMDEADRMLEDGFQDELNEIMSLLPQKRQTMLFSATMNSKIKQLISLSLKKPVRIMIDPPKQAANKLTQEFVRIRKREVLKPALLFQLLKKLDSTGQTRIVVFVSRKETAHRLRIILGLLGLKVAELHGSLTQEQRLESVTQFKSLQVPVLICTDLASRGLDIPKIEVVINFDMPKTYEIYLHRVGRTARAGREGRSISFVGESTQDRLIVKSAIKSVSENMSKSRGKALGRNVNWEEVEKLNKMLEQKGDVITEILDEEKQEKEILRAEMEIKKGENMLKHKNEIQSRPKRTWFQSEKDKKNSQVIQALSANKKTLNSKKRKQQEAREDGFSRSYKKTQGDRKADQERSFKKQKKSDGKKKGRK
ncbi:nucleolar DEAD-box protein required for synthesis of 60S ribosomal subunit [Hanseniaspora vineae]